MTTVEPPIEDPLRKGQPLYKGHFQYHQKCTCNNSFSTSEKRTAFVEGTITNGWSQSVPYSEVPLIVSQNHIL